MRSITSVFHLSSLSSLCSLSSLFVQADGTWTDAPKCINAGATCGALVVPTSSQAASAPARSEDSAHGDAIKVQCDEGYAPASTTTICNASTSKWDPFPECTPCPAGEFFNVTACSRCLPGTISESASAKCEACNIGQQSNPEKTACVGCPAGKVSEEPGQQCKECTWDKALCCAAPPEGPSAPFKSTTNQPCIRRVLDIMAVYAAV